MTHVQACLQLDMALQQAYHICNGHIPMLPLVLLAELQRTHIVHPARRT
jgi:hypothetical protein